MKISTRIFRKENLLLTRKKRNFLRSLRNSYNHSETKMSKLRTKQKLVVCWVQGRIIHQHRRKKMVEGNCCIAAAYLKKTFFFSLSSSRVFWTISNKKIFIKTTPIYNSASKTLQIITNQKQCLLFTYCQMVVNASVIYYNQYWLSFDLCVFCSFHVVKWELPHQPHRFSRSPTPPPQHDCPPVPPPNLCACTPAVHALRALARFSRHFWASQQRRKPKQRLLKTLVSSWRQKHDNNPHWWTLRKNIQQNKNLL